MTPGERVCAECGLQPRAPMCRPGRELPWRRLCPSCVAGFASFFAAGCSGMQSALAPAGREAERIYDIFMWMAIGAAIIWTVMVGLGLYAPRARVQNPRRASNILIIGGGVVFPVTVLTFLLTFGLAEMPAILTPAADGSLSLNVTASQWWWRVQYLAPGRAPIELANEIRLPVGQRVNTRLLSPDVVHSFWIPSLAGKMDVIPGRMNHLALEPTRTGTFRGACAEFCGTSHARMNFVVVVVEDDAFQQWLDQQAHPAVPPADSLAQRGQAVFLERGCVTCHTIRGSPARGVLGPDLTHVGSRQTLAAGLLQTSPEAFARWIAGADHLKPDARMPAFAHLPDDALAALAAYLAGLQ